MKKIIYVFCCFLGIFAVSCATQPKEEKIPEIPETEIQEEPEISQDFSDESEPESFEEKVEDESLPELPEPEVSEGNASDSEEAGDVPFYPVEEDFLSGDENLPPDESGFSEEENLSEIQDDPGSLSEEGNIPENPETEEDASGGISGDVSGPDSPDAENGSDDEAESVPEESGTESGDVAENAGAAPVPSRSMSVPRNRQIDIVYPGKGWVYQGTLDENGNVDTRNRYFVFGGRKLGGEDTTFTVRSRIPGKYLLHFYKNDVLSGTYIDDYLEVTVENEAASDSSHVQAPLYKEAVPPKPARNSRQNETGPAAGFSGTNAEKSTGSVDLNGTETLSSSSANSENVLGQNVSSADSLNSDDAEAGKTPSEILQEAENAFSSKKYQEALSLSDEYLSVSDTGIDEGIFLKARILEAKSPVQDIKESVRLYDLLLETYPQSRLWDKAHERSIYLKRMYINIR